MQFVIFHGAFGNKNGNWFPWLKNKLIELKQEVILEQFPIENWDKVLKTGKNYQVKNQTLANWLRFFEKNILPKIKKNGRLCFIGHSLSPVFILHLVDKFNLQLDSAIFVEPFMEALKLDNVWMFDLVNASFYKTGFDFKKLKRHIPKSYVVYSDNDEYVPIKLPLTFAEKMGSEKILVKDGRHLGENFPEFPLVLDLCLLRIKL